jgi:hypothetical protein
VPDVHGGPFAPPSSMDIAARDVNPVSGAAASAIASAPVVRSEHREGALARMIEQQTAKIPSHVFLMSSFVAMGISVAAEARGERGTSRFVGMWVAPLLIMGLYNKMVKMFGTR